MSQRQENGAGRLWKWLKSNYITVLLPVIGILLWEILVRVFRTPTYLLPAPSVIIGTTLEKIHLLLFQSWVTLYEVLIGFLLGVVVAVPLAVVVVYIPPLEKAFYAFLVSAQAVPKVALAPILVAWFGYGLLPKLVVAFLVCFFPIVINTVIGLQAVSVEMLYLARSLGATGSQQFWRFRLPKALPAIFGGFKVGITLAVVGAVVGEYVAAGQGLGYWQVVAASNLDTPMVFSILVLLSVMGIILFYLIDGLEGLVIKGDPNRAQRRQAAAR